MNVHFTSFISDTSGIISVVGRIVQLKTSPSSASRRHFLVLKGDVVIKCKIKENRG